MRESSMGTLDRYQRAVVYLDSLANLPTSKNYMKNVSHPEFYLKRMSYFLNLLGNPEKGCNYIHVTGTAGKGTVTRSLHEMLAASGQCVGSFSSPGVTSSCETIRVNDACISQAEFADSIESVKPFVDQAYFEGPYGGPSSFELLLAIAFRYFKKKNCHWVVLEVGAGGAYDATNVIQHPAVTAITNIDYDHTAILGKTLQEIAKNKAGIIKRGSAFFTTEKRPQLQMLFRRICLEKQADFHQVFAEEGYQTSNLNLATAIAQHLGIPQECITQGLANTQLPCRFEVVQQRPKVVLDGAHNPLKMRSVVEHLTQQTFRQLWVMIGIADDKDHVAILKTIIPLADKVIFTRFESKERTCAFPKALFLKSKRYLKKRASVEMYLDPWQALERGLKSAHPQDLLLITGSFFLVGELRKYWRENYAL